jgi:predicted phage tail protein
MPDLKIIDVNCNHCGATLQVDEKTRFVTCTYCHSRLAIQRSESAVFTEVLDKIEQNTGQMAENLELIRLQNELEQIDREWMMSRENLMVQGRNGSRSVPSVAGGIFTIIFGVVAGGIWMTFAYTAVHAPPLFCMFGLVFMGAAVFGGVNMVSKAGRLDVERRDYETRRQSLLAEIDSEKRRQH